MKLDTFKYVIIGCLALAALVAVSSSAVFPIMLMALILLMLAFTLFWLVNNVYRARSLKNWIETSAIVKSRNVKQEIDIDNCVYYHP
jgi:hypothetical protein